jgi:hypothetical protein
MVARSHRRNQNKHQVERFYADKIVRAFAPTAFFLTMGDADWRQPDVLYAFEKQLLGIEITGIYYSEQHAKSVRNRCRPTASQQAVNFKFSMSESDNLTRCKIREVIEKKTQKSYQRVDQAWLGIHQEAELSDKSSTDIALRQIRIPKSHPFTRIFLVHRLPWHDGLGYRVVQFFPTWKTHWFQPRNLFADAILDVLHEPEDSARRTMASPDQKLRLFAS